MLGANRIFFALIGLAFIAWWLLPKVVSLAVGVILILLAGYYLLPAKSPIRRLVSLMARK